MPIAHFNVTEDRSRDCPAVNCLSTVLGVEWAPCSSRHHVLIVNGPDRADWTDATAATAAQRKRNEKTGKSEWKERKKKQRE